MKPLIELELGSINFGYYRRFMGEKNISIDEFVFLEKKYKLKLAAKNTTYLTSLLFIIIFPITNLLISSLVVSLIYLISYFFTLHNFYDWIGLYESIKKNGFEPNDDNGYITVSKIDGNYACQNGNHRIAILNLIYGKSYKLKVLEVPSEPNINKK
tara:strand:- start:10014 stop:10481 length:468 start_codon:yes stop_codon:yes gene_type:complete